MTNKEIYKMLYQLGMINTDENNCCYLDDRDRPSSSELFQDCICKDITGLTAFVNDLFLNNDVNYIKQFLICLLFKNGENKNDTD